MREQALHHADMTVLRGDVQRRGTVLVSVVTEVVPNAVIAADVIAAIASSVAAVNTVVSDPNLDPLSDVALDIVQAAQEGLQTSVTDVVSGDVAVTDFETATDTTKLFEDIVVSVDALDTDEDGVPDALDTDDDADGVLDAKDVFPLDKNEMVFSLSTLAKSPLPSPGSE